jgi:hypothetical protein
VTDVDGAAERPRLLRERSPSRRLVAVIDVSDHQRSSRAGGGFEALGERESLRGAAHALSALDAPPAIEAEPAAPVDPDRAGGAECSQRGVGVTGVEHRDRPVIPGDRRFSAAGVAGRDPALGQPAGNPREHQRSAPAGVRPKLCSMKARSVSTSFGNA